MKIKIVLIVFLLLLFQNIYSQNFWHETGFNSGGKVLALTITPNGYVYAGHSTGIYRSTNGGTTWIRVYQTPVEVLSLTENDSNGYIYAGLQTSGSQYGGIYRSINNGSSWQLKGLSGKKINDLLVSASGTVFAGSSTNYLDGGVFKSTDNGNSWINCVIPDYHVQCLAIDINSNIYAGTDDPGPSGYPTILKSTNDGNTWNTLYQWTGYSTYVRGIAINNIGYMFAYFSSRVFRSTNNGITWSQVLFGISEFSKLPFIVNSLNHIFAGSMGSGIYRSTNYGLNWAQINSGLTNLNIYSFAIDDSEYVYAGADNRIFKTAQSTITSISKTNSEVPVKFSLSQNYPNPFNPITNIKFDLPKSSDTKLIVYDALGREVATLVNEKLSAGSYEVYWFAPTEDGGGYSSGVYFYKLEATPKYGQAGEFVMVKKMVMLK